MYEDHERVHAVSLVAMLGLSDAHVCIDMYVMCLYIYIYTYI